VLLSNCHSDDDIGDDFVADADEHFFYNTNLFELKQAI